MREKVFIITFLFLLPVTSGNGYGQQKNAAIRVRDLIGLWQLRTKSIDTVLNDYYRFYPNGSFEYYFTCRDYASVSRLQSVKGKYELKNYELIFTIISYVEKKGGKLSYDVPDGCEGWGFVGDTLVVKKAKNKKTSVGIGVEYDKNGRITYIQIDYEKYFKISRDPGIDLNTLVKKPSGRLN